MTQKRKNLEIAISTDSIKHRKNDASITTYTSSDISLQNKKNILVWFRTDLRIQDNPALYKASSLATNNYVFTLFVISPEEWESHDVAPIRVDFWLRNLNILKEKLNILNIPVIVEKVNKSKNVPKFVIELCEKLNIDHLFANIEYEVDELKRDKDLLRLANSNSIKVEMIHSQCVVKPGSIKTKAGTPYTVYSPFKNTWLAYVESNKSLLEISPPLTKSNDNSIKSSYPETFNYQIPDSIPGFELGKELSSTSKVNFPAGEEEAHERLSKFVQSRIQKYEKNRDIPSMNGTSILSPYLASGIISARQCINAAVRANNINLSIGKPGVVRWIEEIIWRDFYRHVLFSFPHVCKYQPFKKTYANIEWDNNEEKFKRWREGRTGYPIVDAGIKQLNKSGWMHNRVRMIVAMFLQNQDKMNMAISVAQNDINVNSLFLFRIFDIFQGKITVSASENDNLLRNVIFIGAKGLELDNNTYESDILKPEIICSLCEQYFMKNLIDGDFASNNGGWQWPYFRIFNPTTQSVKFDSNGDYIRRWLPELKDLDSKVIHDPFKFSSKKEFEKLG
ncbi:21992_t:CDS:2 [Entrophospora sp. SA101]|nr:21986_t:CDS:2 [Entrophospora sp. SA101]CAJ0912576.1 21992_t:CDS:2 [Entrophospora sp. SA101]